MNVLVAMPVTHRAFAQLDQVVAGEVPCSGTDGAILRLAMLLHQAGINVCLSAASPIGGSIPCLTHDQVCADRFDHLIVHQSHWNGHALTFGEAALRRTILWAHVTDPVAFLYTFLDASGRQVVFPSVYHANLYREIPQWRRQFAVIPNSYSAAFQPVNPIAPANRLIFIGAISPHKGFAQLTRVWSYLAAQRADLQLVIAGSRSLHGTADYAPGKLRIADVELETTCIQPWLESLPDTHQPVFLGELSPLQLRQEIAQSWAAIVNPNWTTVETFCIAAVDAQACGRTVFSVAHGGLKETVYRGQFDSLVAQPAAAALGDRILAGLRQRQTAEFVRRQFADDRITAAWIDLLAGRSPQALPSQWHSLRDLTHDLMRWSGTGMLLKQRLGGNQPVNRQVLQTYYALKQKS
jgi:glycosyltransferase involved in cell wall biosynthesis